MDAIDSGSNNLFASLIANSVDAARKAVDQHIVDGDQGYLFPYAPGDDRRIDLDSPQKAKDAATLLITLTQAVRLADEGDNDGAWGSMFAAGYFSHEVLLAAGLGCPSHEAISSYEKTQAARRKGGSASKSLNPSQEKLALSTIKTKLIGKISKTAACTRAAASLKKEHSIEVSKDTLLRLWNKHSKKSNA